MDRINSSLAIFYSITAVVSFAIVYLIMQWLSWPLLATTAVGAALFIHLVNLARVGKNLVVRELRKGTFSDLNETFQMFIHNPQAPAKKESES
jgi:hypothetical protein